ncbi:MAG: WG repeat-containing protein, partial [Clostridia bacterium]|nr:WG repeat-containing protein [Clostridia bacterium]
MKNSIRFITLILCVILIFVSVPVSSFASEDKEYRYTSNVVDSYYSFLRESTCYGRNINDKAFHYKVHIDSMNDNGILKKGVLFAGNVLMDKHLDLESYTKYLSNLVAMVGSGYTEATYIQSTFTANKNFVEYDSKAVEALLKEFLSDAGFKILKDGISVLSKGYKLVDISTKPIETMAQTALLLTISTDYDRKITVLNAIYENTDNTLLKLAAEDVIHMCDLEFMYLLDTYVYNVANSTYKLIKELNKDTFEKLYADIKDTVEKGFLKWIKKSAGTGGAEAAGKIFKAATWMCAALPYVKIGIKIGVSVMKPIADLPYEYFREERAMDNISDALITALVNKQAEVESTSTTEDKLKKITEFVYIGEFLLYTHTRGEYCNLQNCKWTYDSYNDFDTRMYRDFEDLESILAGKGVYESANGSGGDGAYIVRYIESDNQVCDVYGDPLYGYVDIRTGETVLEPQFESADPCFGDDGWAKVYCDGEPAIINIKGEHLLPYGSAEYISDFVGGEYFLVQTKDRKLKLYKGGEYISDLKDFPMKDYTEVTSSILWYENNEYYDPENYIFIDAVNEEGDREYYWYDLDGEFICAVDDWKCGLVGDDTGYYLFHRRGVDIYDSDRNFVETKELANIGGVPRIAYDGDKWYVIYCEDGYRYKIYTNGLTELKLTYIDDEGNTKEFDLYGYDSVGNPREIFANSGIITIYGYHFRSDGRLIYSTRKFYYTPIKDAITTWYSFSNGYVKIAYGEPDDFCGYVDTTGKEVFAIDPEEFYYYSQTYRDGIFFHYVDGYWNIEDFDGTLSERKFIEIGDYAD